MTNSRRTAAERQAIDRDGPNCRRCGRDLTEQRASVHHRLKRRHAEADQVANLVVLCGSGTTGCHGWCHASKTQHLAHEQGWVCWSWEKPAERPLVTTLGTMLMLGTDGSVESDSLLDGQDWAGVVDVDAVIPWT